jgi:hypothetical protein
MNTHTHTHTTEILLLPDTDGDNTLDVTVPANAGGTVSLHRLSGVINDVIDAMGISTRFDYKTFTGHRTYLALVMQVDAELGFTTEAKKVGCRYSVTRSKAVSAKKGKGGSTEIHPALAKLIFDVVIGARIVVCPAREKVSETSALIAIEHVLKRPLQRQYAIHPYVVDAIDHQTNTVYEVYERSAHARRKVYDENRIRHIRRLGYTVEIIRIPY